MIRPLGFLDDLRPAFVAHLAERLSEQICAETQAVATRHGVVAPVRSHSTMLFLLRRGPATIAEMARTDGQSHQLLASRIAPIERAGLIERFDDPADARRRPYRLTKSGRAEAEAIAADTRRTAAAMEQVFTEIGVDLIAAIEQAAERLRRHPLADRIAAFERMEAGYA